MRVSGVYHVDEVRSQVQLAQSHAFLGLGVEEHYTIGFMSTKIIIIAWGVIAFWGSLARFHGRQGGKELG